LSFEDQKWGFEDCNLGLWWLLSALPSLQIFILSLLISSFLHLSSLHDEVLKDAFSGRQVNELWLIKHMS